MATTSETSTTASSARASSAVAWAPRPLLHPPTGSPRPTAGPAAPAVAAGARGATKCGAIGARRGQRQRIAIAIARLCWSRWFERGMENTVDRRQTPICLSKLPFIVGVSLKRKQKRGSCLENSWYLLDLGLELQL